MNSDKFSNWAKGEFSKRSVNWEALFIIWAIGAFVTMLAAVWLMTNPHFYQRVAHTNACIANLKQIQGAIEQYALEQKLGPTNRVKLRDISGGTDKFIRPRINLDLTCPQGGTYSIKTVEDAPRCSVTRHTIQ